MLFLSYGGEDVSEPRAVRRWVRIPLAVSGVMRSNGLNLWFLRNVCAKKKPHSRTPFSTNHSEAKSKVKPKHLIREVLFLSYGGEDLKRQKSNLGKKTRRIVLNFFFHRGRIVLLFDRNLY